MAEETVTLRIKLSAEEAKALLADFEGGIQDLALEAKAAAPPADQLAAEMAGLARQIKTSADMAKVFGRDATTLKAEQDSLRASIRNLIAQGLDPESEEVKQLKAEYDRLNAEMGETTTQTKTTKSAFEGMSSLLGPLTRFLSAAAIGAAVLGAAVAGINYNKMAETSQVAFETFLGDGDRARALIVDLQDLSAKTPLEFPDIRSAAQQLLAVKVQAEAIPDTIRMIGDVAAGVGAPITDLAYLFAKVKSQGRATSEELMSFASRGIDIFGALGEELEKTPEQIREMSSQGKIGFAEIERAFKRMTAEGGTFHDLMAKQALTFAGLQSTLSDNMNRLAGFLAGGFTNSIKSGMKEAIDLTGAAEAEAMAWGDLLGEISDLILNRLIPSDEVKANLGEISQAMRDLLTALLPLFDIIGRLASEGVGGALSYVASLFSWLADLVKGYVDFYTSLLSGDLSGAFNAFVRIALGFVKPFASIIETVIEKAAGAVDKLIAIVNKFKPGTFKPFDLDLNWSKDIAKLIDDLETVSSFGRGGMGGKGSKAPEYTPPTPPGYTPPGTSGGTATEDAVSALFEIRRKILSESASLESQFLAEVMKLNQEEVDLQSKAIEAMTKAGTGWLEWSQVLVDLDAAYQAKRIAAENAYAAKARAFLFDQANEARKAEADLTDTKIDNLELERDRELALFSGTQEDRAAIAARWAAAISATEIEEAQKAASARLQAMKTAFEEMRRLAAESGNWGKFAGAEFQSQAAQTDVGRMAGWGGSAAIDPMQVLIESAIKLALSFESIQRVLNIFTSIGDEMAPILDPLINDALMPLLDLIVAIAEPFAEILSPLISIVALILRLNPNLRLTEIAFGILGDILLWLNDEVIVPVGNLIIGLFNGILSAVNWVITLFGGTALPLIEALQTSEELAAEAERTSAAQEKIADAMEDLQEYFDDQSKALKDAYDDNINALGNLLELGVISEEEYASRVADYAEEYKAQAEALEEERDAQLDAVQALSDAIADGTMSVEEALAELATILEEFDPDAESPSPATGDGAGTGIRIEPHPVPGTTTTPIIPLFSESFSTRSSRGGGDTTVNYFDVTVEGDVTAEGDLAVKLATLVKTRTGRGQAEEDE